jgi:hypothetical protein
VLTHQTQPLQWLEDLDAVPTDPQLSAALHQGIGETHRPLLVPPPQCDKGIDHPEVRVYPEPR